MTNRGPYISAIGRCYCVNHFTCSKCSTNLTDTGFVEENGKLYCEQDFEQFLAPHCAKCSQAILKVIQKNLRFGSQSFYFLFIIGMCSCT